MQLSFRASLLAHLGAIFVAAFTPNNTGVGPATVAALNRLGVPLGRGIGVAVQLFVLDLIFFACSVPLGLAYLVYSDAMALPPVITVAALAASALAITLAVALIALTISQWFGSFMLLWALLGLYGVNTHPLTILAILSSLTLVSHLVPTPGAAGFMEAAVGLSIGTRAGGDTAALLIWRLASFYVIFILGPLAGWLLHLARPMVAPNGMVAGASSTRQGSGRP